MICERFWVTYAQIDEKQKRERADTLGEQVVLWGDRVVAAGFQRRKRPNEQTLDATLGLQMCFRTPHILVSGQRNIHNIHNVLTST